MKPVELVIAGCGAITEMYHAPSLVEMEKQGLVKVLGLFDPEAARVASIQAMLPGARACGSLADLIATGAQAAMVASPPRFHGTQTCELLRAGMAVLCEKPMSITVAESEQMLAAAAETRKPLAIGLVRRFFPALQAIKDLLSNETLGPVKSFRFPEGGSFGWPAQSPSFFQKAASGGGVLLDVGVHVLDLVQWWFGEPVSLEYADDALGGLEANCRLRLTYASYSGEIRLSRDTPLANRYLIHCERGTIAWDVMQVNQIDVTPLGARHVLRSAPHQPLVPGKHFSPQEPAGTFYTSFNSQMRNFLSAVGGAEPLQVPGEEGIKSLRLIEQCYQQRTLLEMPWLNSAEKAEASELFASQVAAA